MAMPDTATVPGDGTLALYTWLLEHDRESSHAEAARIRDEEIGQARDLETGALQRAFDDYMADIRAARKDADRRRAGANRAYVASAEALNLWYDVRFTGTPEEVRAAFAAFVRAHRNTGEDLAA